MAIILKSIQVASLQPVTRGKPFDIVMVLERYPTGRDDPPAVAKFWCEAAYSVTPSHVPVDIPDGSDTATQGATITLTGGPGNETVRLLGQADEIRSVFVQVT